ncbi:hypothetical protein HPB48_014251 [Haemaphysalis longicornis]|uniref:Uncharacterized protein n=1 Tax=Haemaphysalis longicornis TaxID=44386 RepID=A0A9J6FJG5_HAELO|nr:hypothetical protein HPB48_014251 [Haemaphysalis longicornis]
MATFADLAGDRERKEDHSRRDGTEQYKSMSPAHNESFVVERAMEDPGLLSPLETECLVRVLCGKVVRETGTSSFIADFCISAMSKERGRAFADLLITYIHQWFNKRSELLPRRVQREDHIQGSDGEAAPLYKWTAFVDFLADLLVAMAGAGWCSLGHKSLWRVTVVAVVLCDCWDIMLRNPAYDVLEEVKCLRSSLVVAGKTAYSVAAERVEDLVAMMRGASKSRKFPPEAQKVLIELLELLDEKNHLKQLLNLM